MIVLLASLASPGFGQAPAANPVPIDQSPYSIRVRLDFDPSTRVDAGRRAAILDDWLALVDRFVGSPWTLSGFDRPGVLPPSAVEDWEPSDLKTGIEKDPVDKVWAIRVKAEGASWSAEGRELDVATGWLGEVHRRAIAHPSDAPRELLRLALAMFAPSADVGESKDGGVSFLVKGASVPPSSPMGAVAPPGTVFRALRVFPKPDGQAPEIIEVKYSYFRVERLDGPVAHCEIIRGLGDPLTNRYARRNKLVALGVKPADSPTRLRFLARADRRPAAGYRLIGRTIPPGPKPMELGTTDRDGRIELPAGFADGLVSLRLLAGHDEPMADVPVMPGETPKERAIIFEARPATLTIEARLEALRDAIIDVVADRSRLESRMKARLDGEDWAGLDATIRDFRKLPSREQFEAKLKQIRDDGEHLEAETKSLVLTKNARAALDDTKALIDRYLDDELVRSYDDASQRGKAEAAAAAKSATKKKGAPK